MASKKSVRSRYVLLRQHFSALTILIPWFWLSNPAASVSQVALFFFFFVSDCIFAFRMLHFLFGSTVYKTEYELDFLWKRNCSIISFRSWNEHCSKKKKKKKVKAKASIYKPILVYVIYSYFLGSFYHRANLLCVPLVCWKSWSSVLRTNCLAIGPMFIHQVHSGNTCSWNCWCKYFHAVLSLLSLLRPQLWRGVHISVIR